MIEKLKRIEVEILNEFPDVMCTQAGIDTMHFLRFRLMDNQFVITISPACQLQICSYALNGEIKTSKPFFYGKINQQAALKRMIETIKELSE